jgi:1-deoxy-D-xylulose-5-phosphate reductoisomerase
MKKKTIAILGSTGSIGQSTLELIKKSNEFEVKLLFANKNFFKIINQIRVFKPSIVIVNNENIFLKIKKRYQKKKNSCFKQHYLYSKIY